MNLAIAIAPNLAKAHNNLTIAYHTAGKYDLAWQHLCIAQRLNYAVNPQLIELVGKDANKKANN